MLEYGEAPFLECSSKGDKRFSAFCAYLRERGDTIENIYQAAKVFEDGTTGLTWKEAKGKRAVNMDEVRQLYADLWVDYMAENPELIYVLAAASGLRDVFGQPGNACQAEELWKIREAFLESLPKIDWIPFDDGWGIVGYGYDCPCCGEHTSFGPYCQDLVQCEKCKEYLHNSTRPE